MERARLPAREALRQGVARTGKQPTYTRATKQPTKVAVSLRLTREVVERFKADGPGWQSRMDQALKKAAGL
jgi:uncharacterized protein (DUF4415 family)